MCSSDLQQVVATAGASSDDARRLRSRRTSGLPVEFVEVDDDIDEVAVARRIIEQQVRSGIDPSVAVLARTHQLLEPVKTSLTAAGIPVASRRASTMRANAIDEVAECRTRHDLTVWAADVIVESTDEDERIVAEQLQAYLRSSTQGTVDGRSAAAFLRASHSTPERYGVELLTFHAAKGREFSVVVIIGAERGLLPHSSAKIGRAHV